MAITRPSLVNWCLPLWTVEKISDAGIVGKENAKVGQGNAFKRGWIKKDKFAANIRRLNCR